MIFEDDTEEIASEYLDSSRNRLTPPSTESEGRRLTPQSTEFEGQRLQQRAIELEKHQSTSTLLCGSESAASSSPAGSINFNHLTDRRRLSGIAHTCNVISLVTNISIPRAGQRPSWLLLRESKLNDMDQVSLLWHFGIVIGFWVYRIPVHFVNPTKDTVQ